MELEFEVPGRPQGKGRPRAYAKAGHARVYTPGKTVTYENWIKACYLAAHGRTRLSGEVEISICAFYAVPKSYRKTKRAQCIADAIHPTSKPDGDNIQKAVADALNGIAYRDDSAVWAWHLEKHYGTPERLVVRLTGDIEEVQDQ